MRSAQNSSALHPAPPLLHHPSNQGVEERRVPQAGSRARTGGSPSATHPAWSPPLWTGSWAVGELWEWAARPCSPPYPQGKAGLSPWGTPPPDRCHTAPASPDQSGNRTLPFAWKGPESPALVCPRHFTVCMEGTREPRPGVPTTLHSLHGKAPRAPPWCAHNTSQFAWKGPESPALVCPPHFTVFTFP